MPASPAHTPRINSDGRAPYVTQLLFQQALLTWTISEAMRTSDQAGAQPAWRQRALALNAIKQRAYRLKATAQ